MKLALLVPTKKRPQAIKELFETFKETKHYLHTLMYPIIDDDDDSYNTRGFAEPHFRTTAKRGLNNILNEQSLLHVGTFDIVGFCGDDHRFRTKDWDAKVYQAFADGACIVSGNDLGKLQYKGYQLPTFWFMDSRLIKAMGYMCPPELQHFYMDNFMVDLGIALNGFVSIPDLVVEHMHPLWGKGEWDATYKETNHTNKPQQDQEAYEKYLNTRFLEDIEKCKKVIQ